MKRDSLCNKDIVKTDTLVVFMLGFHRQFLSVLMNGFCQRAVV